MSTLLKIKFTLSYLFAIALVSSLFTFYPLLINLTPTVSVTPWAILVGAWFVLRDYSQREIGHWVFIPMIIGIIICTFINPALGLASAAASTLAELTDWAIYTFTKRPFHHRVIISSVVASIIDTIIFFGAFDFFQVIPGVTIFNWGTVLLGILSKCLAIAFVYYHHRKSLVPTS